MRTMHELLTSDQKIPIREREDLLAFVCARPREWILAYPEVRVHPARAARYRRLVHLRARGVPLPYLVGGVQWFFGRPFRVTRDVLIPRPESELLVELATRRIKNQESRIKKIQIPDSRFQILDIGTGSGCLVVTMAAEIPHRISKFKFQILATDSSPAALRVARGNAKENGVADRITFLCGDLLEPIVRMTRDRQFQISNSKFQILANLPYLTTAEWRALPRSLQHYEPRSAFDGGPDGLRSFRALFAQLVKLQARSCKLQAFLEIDPRRKHMLAGLVRNTLPAWEASWHRDLAGRWRVLELTAPR